MEYLYISLSISIFIFLFIFNTTIKRLLFLLEMYFYEKNREILFRRFSEIWAIYVDNKEKSFKSLYKQHLAVLYTSKITTVVKKEEISKLEHTFIKRVVEMCGKSIINDLRKMMDGENGGTDPIVRDLSEYYSEQILELEAGTYELEQKLEEYDDFEVNEEVRENVNKIFKK